MTEPLAGTASEADPYRRNPARDVEVFALTVVKYWLGNRGRLEDTSLGHEPDFHIEYPDGRHAWGEVGWHEDPELRAMWSNAFRKEHHQQIDLAPGLGAWTIGLARGASIKRLYNELPAFVQTLSQLGCNRLSITGNWPRGEPADTARRLGVEYLHRVDERPDVAVFFMPSTGGVLLADANAVPAWVSTVLASQEYSDTTQKLLAKQADERHVFLMSGSRTPYDVDEQLRRLGKALPTHVPTVPSGITHVWVTSQFGNGPGALWIAGTGWSTVELPAPVSQDTRSAGAEE
jgi:hypothetical protein